ncbi:hypothetical protein AB3S75_044250 [Citrus x aurantiifolia]
MYPLAAACGEGHEEALSKDEEEEMKRRDLELRLRRGLIKKVYCILASQLLFGDVVYAVAKIHPPITAFFKKNLLYLNGPVIIGTFFCIPMMLFPKKSFLNVALLLFSTVGMLVPVAVSIPDRPLVGLNERMVLAALLSTLATVASLTKFTFWASKKGKDKALNQLEPLVQFGLVFTFTNGIMKWFNSAAAIAVLHVFICSGFVICSTHKLLKRFGNDEYIGAPAHLFFFIFGLFVKIWKILWTCYRG